MQSDLNFQAKAIEALQHAAEDYLVLLYEDVSLFLLGVAYLVSDLSRLLFAVAGEFGGNTRQESHYSKKRHRGLATLSCGSSVARKLIAVWCRLRGVSGGSGLKLRFNGCICIKRLHYAPQSRVLSTARICSMASVMLRRCASARRISMSSPRQV